MILSAAYAVCAAGILWGLWSAFCSPTRVAFLNYQVLQLSEISHANDSPWIRLSELTPEDAGKAGKYDILLINGMGLRITAEQRAALQKAAEKGLPVISTMVTNPANNITSADSAATAEIQRYLANGGPANYRNMLAYIRRNVDRKRISAPVPPSPEEYVVENIYRPGPDGELGFRSLSEYEEFLKNEGLYRKDAPKVIVTGQMGEPSELMHALENSGNTVYVIRDIRSLLSNGALDSIAPSAVINMAHGRLGDDAVGFLERHNIPLFSPLNVNMQIKDWMEDPMGMNGGFMSQSIVTPEIDGAIRPFVLFGHYLGQNGLPLLKAVPDRLEEFVETVNSHIRLKTKPAAEKKLAIYYYKGAGLNTMTAAGMEVPPSLYNFLKELERAGYDVSGLPQTEEEFSRVLNSKGKIFGTYAHGAAAEFMKNADPEWIEKETYAGWVEKAIPSELYSEVVSANGDFPGEYMVSDDRLAVSRVRFGNIVLIPQPAAGGGDDEFKMVHGTGSAPPHSYIAAYLYARFGFGADAMIHFGTHGSLEFTPRKQVALGSTDWPDRLVGTLPHIYLYSIANVGEGMMAKRRSYATLQSYLTAPFMESGVRGQYKELSDLFQKYDDNHYSDSPDPGRASELSLKIKQTADRMGISSDLGLDTTSSEGYSHEEIVRLENFAEELASEKVTGRLYVLGEHYQDEHIRTTVEAMAVDPIAYGLYNLDVIKGKASKELLSRMPEFNRIYIKKAESIVGRIRNQASPVTDRQVTDAAGITPEEYEKAKKIAESMKPAPDMMQMMRMMAAKSDKDTGAGNGSNTVEKGDRPHKMKETGAKMNPAKALEMARKMGADAESLKKMEKAMKEGSGKGTGHDSTQNGRTNGHEGTGMSGMMAMAGKMMSSIRPEYSDEELEFSRAVMEVRQAMQNVGNYRRALLESPEKELSSILNALDGGYTSPSPGGDPVANPNTLPTGRNLYGINAESVPTRSAWEKGKSLAQNTIDLYRRRHNDSIPRQVSYTLWSSEFIETEGATIAQVFYMLGVEPLYDTFGRVTDVRLIPSEDLGRPRIDVLVQTSGQLRDIAASRLFLIDRAVKMASAANDESYPNYVSDGVRETERLLTEKGITPKDARKMSSYRVFGGVNGSYGSGIQSMVEASDRWKSSSEVARVYLNNMGAYYGSEEDWENFSANVFESAMARTDIVVQPRQSNTWGALSLDHVYEFMGGLNLAVKEVTGKDPDAYMSDYRNRNRSRIQELKEAIGVESRTTIFNPSYISEKMKGGAGDADAIAETITNTFGWNVMKPDAIDDRTWNEIYETYVKDKYNLGVRGHFEDVNPAALEEITAVMMESSRKGMWNASESQLADIAELHTDLVRKFSASCSGFVCDNPSLKEFIAGNVSDRKASEYKQAIHKAREASAEAGMVLKKESMDKSADTRTTAIGNVAALILAAAFVSGVVIIIIRRRKKN